MAKNIEPNEQMLNQVGHTEQLSLLDRGLLKMFGFQLADVLSARYYSEDFNETRSLYIIARARQMAFLFAIFVPLWAFVDYFTISEAHFPLIFIARLTLAAALGALGWYCYRGFESNRLVVILPLLFVLPSLFYVGSVMLLQSGVAELPSVGFSYLPFLIVSMMGLLPLTLRTTLSIIFLILLLSAWLEYMLGQLFTLQSLDKLWVFLMFAGISIWLQIGQLIILLKLYREATLDPLTNLINRRVLIKRLELEKARCEELGAPFSVLMFDLDRFKRVNDTYGHLVGDLVLNSIAQLIQSKLYKREIVARFGGEEFVAILPEKDTEQATKLAEEIRKNCAEKEIETESGVRLNVTTSIGVTQYEPTESIDVMLARVDGSLYRAKSRGRNLVVSSQSQAVEQITNPKKVTRSRSRTDENETTKHDNSTQKADN